MTLDLSAYKPTASTPRNAAPIANAFTAIETEVNDLPLANIAQGAAVNGQALVWDTATGSWAPAFAGPGDPVTSLPASPSDKQQALLVDSLTAPTYAWLFQYEAGISDANKWVCIGGAEASANGAPNAVMNTLTQVGATGFYYTTGMTITVPRAGVYDVRGVVRLDGNGSSAIMSLQCHAAAALVSNSRVDAQSSLGTSEGAATTARTGSVAASAVVGIACGGTVGTHKILEATVFVRPFRVA